MIETYRARKIRIAFESTFSIPDGVEYNQELDTYSAGVYSNITSLAIYRIQYDTWKACADKISVSPNILT